MNRTTVFTAFATTLGLAIWTDPALAGPQHFGFGFGYLVTIEQDATGRNALSAYEPPLRVKDSPWLLRWRDASQQYQSALPNGLAVGDFWPQTMGAKEYVVMLAGAKGNDAPTLMVLDPPEVFSTRPWKALAQKPLPDWPAGVQIIAAAGGDVLGAKRDQFVVLVRQGGVTRLLAWQPGEKPDQAWTLAATCAFPPPTGKPLVAITGMTIGDFWGTGQDTVLLRYADGTLAYCAPRVPSAPANSPNKPQQITFNAPATEQLTGAAATGLLVGCDFLKDGFAYLAQLPASADEPKMNFRTAPRQETRYRTCWVHPDETFAGAKLTGQKIGESRQVMTGQRETPWGRVIAAGGGRIFGYIVDSVDTRKDKLWKPWKYHGYDDVEISFAHRTPLFKMGCYKKYQDDNWPWEPDDHFGWPFKDDEVTYEISIKNNGTQTIPAGKLLVQAWVNTPHRNADTLPGRKDAAQPAPPDFTFTLDKPLPPFDPTKPQYAIVKIPLKWPFDLVQPQGWKYKRINVRDIGERWLVVQVGYPGDQNERNNRYELALNSTLFRPVWRFDVDAPPGPAPDGIEGRPDRKINTLAYRAPCVAGDPESKEYNGRKLADAVQCMWERSRTSTGDDVWQRVVFDSYRLYDTQGRNGLKGLNRADDWLYYEAPREGEHWVGLWGDYERFDPRDGGAELHETGHLVHRIGDLYHYFVNPINLNTIHMGDGDPVQMRTYAWGLDSYCSGHAIIGEPTCDLHRYIEGTRIGLGWAWHKMLPAKIHVRVLDRDGQPIANAPITLWLHPQNQKFSNGVTGADGQWEPQLTTSRDVYEAFNIPQYDGPGLDALAHVFVVDLPGYSDFMIWGAEDVAAHSRYTLMQASLRHPENWTWDFHTLYKAGAPPADFKVTAGVQGRQITLTIDTQPNATYHIYRRWEPTYTYQLLGQAALAPASGDSHAHATFTDNMGAEDWYMSKRYRATYYVTRVLNGAESLPRRVYGIGVDNVTGVSTLDNGQLVVAENAGNAEPFGILCRGTTPLMEAMKHFRFGHSAAKIIGVPGQPQRFYATLRNADMDWSPRYFDMIQLDLPDRNQHMYAVLEATNLADAKDVSNSAPFTITLNRADPESRLAINPGDWAGTGEEDRVRILAVDGLKLTLEKPLFKDPEHGPRDVHIEFGGGTPGAKAELRELNKPLGLATISAADKPNAMFIAIADTGNHRVVVWDHTTRYVAQWQPQDAGADFRPVAVAADPLAPDHCFVLDRRADRKSVLHRLQFTGNRLTEARDFPAPIEVGAAEGQWPEMGLAVAALPGSSKRVFAITDAGRKRVLELDVYGKYRPGDQPGTAKQADVLAVYAKAIGTFVGDAALLSPTDVAYVVEDGELHLYAADGHNRIVRLR